MYLNQKLIAVESIQLPLITLQMEHRVHAFLDLKNEKEGANFSFKRHNITGCPQEIRTTPSPARECKR